MGYIAYVWQTTRAFQLIVWGSLAALAISIVAHTALVHIPSFPAPARFAVTPPKTSFIHRPTIEFSIESAGRPHPSHLRYSATLPFATTQGSEMSEDAWLDAKFLLLNDATLQAQFGPLLEDGRAVTTRVANRSAVSVNLAITASEHVAVIAILLIVFVFTLVVALRPWLLGRRHLCRKCFYDLQGVESVFCPECGHPTG